MKDSPPPSKENKSFIIYDEHEILKCAKSIIGRQTKRACSAWTSPSSCWDVELLAGRNQNFPSRKRNSLNWKHVSFGEKNPQNSHISKKKFLHSHDVVFRGISKKAHFKKTAMGKFFPALRGHMIYTEGHMTWCGTCGRRRTRRRRYLL